MNRKEEKMSIKDMTKYMAEIKARDIPTTKRLIDSHVNIAHEIRNRQRNIDYMQCMGLERQIIEGDYKI